MKWDDNQRYPYFRKPPYKRSESRHIHFLSSQDRKWLDWNLTGHAGVFKLRLPLPKQDGLERARHVAILYCSLPAKGYQQWADTCFPRKLGGWLLKITKCQNSVYHRVSILTHVDGSFPNESPKMGLSRFEDKPIAFLVGCIPPYPHFYIHVYIYICTCVKIYLYIPVCMYRYT